MEENECYTAEYIDVPNVLADLFKSFVCAIYLDSGRDLNLTWTICFNLMKTEIGKLKIYMLFYFTFLSCIINNVLHLKKLNILTIYKYIIN